MDDGEGGQVDQGVSIWQLLCVNLPGHLNKTGQVTIATMVHPLVGDK